MYLTGETQNTTRRGFIINNTYIIYLIKDVANNVNRVHDDDDDCDASDFCHFSRIDGCFIP